MVTQTNPIIDQINGMTWATSSARYGRPIGCDFDVALAIALAYTSPEMKLMALYELDARTNHEHHDALVEQMRALEVEVGA